MSKVSGLKISMNDRSIDLRQHNKQTSKPVTSIIYNNPNKNAESPSSIATPSENDKKFINHNLRKLGSRTSDKIKGHSKLPKSFRRISHEPVPEIEKLNKETMTDIAEIYNETKKREDGDINDINDPAVADPYEDLTLTKSQLLSKYIFQKVPLKKSWTIPVFSPKSSVNIELVSNSQSKDNSETGSDIKEEKLFHKVIHTMLSALSALMGFCFGILMIAIFISYIHYYYEPKPIPMEENNTSINEYIIFVGNTLTNTVSTAVNKVMWIVTLPANQVFSKTDQQWYWPFHLE